MRSVTWPRAASPSTVPTPTVQSPPRTSATATAERTVDSTASATAATVRPPAPTCWARGRARSSRQRHGATTSPAPRTGLPRRPGAARTEPGLAQRRRRPLLAGREGAGGRGDAEDDELTGTMEAAMPATRRSPSPPVRSRLRCESAVRPGCTAVRSGCPPTPTPPSTARGASSTTSTCASPTSRPAGASTPPPSRPWGSARSTRGRATSSSTSCSSPQTARPRSTCTSPSRPATARPSSAGTPPSWTPAAATTAGRASASTTPAYYGAFALDPDGNNVEAVNHGPATRSVDAVEHRPA